MSVRAIWVALVSRRGCEFPSLTMSSLILKNAVGIIVKNSCNPILDCVCDKKLQLLRTCHESAVNN
ncbi:MAG: hypothetical protein RL610_1439 [Pseudomonadota bacterium]|jgi:hypothetical protein